MPTLRKWQDRPLPLWDQQACTNILKVLIRNKGTTKHAKYYSTKRPFSKPCPLFQTQLLRIKVGHVLANVSNFPNACQLEACLNSSDPLTRVALAQRIREPDPTDPFSITPHRIQLTKASTPAGDQIIAIELSIHEHKKINK